MPLFVEVYGPVWLYAVRTVNTNKGQILAAGEFYLRKTFQIIYFKAYVQIKPDLKKMGVIKFTGNARLHNSVSYVCDFPSQTIPPGVYNDNSV